MRELELEGPEDIITELAGDLRAQGLQKQLTVKKNAALEGAAYLTLVLDLSGLALQAISVWLAANDYARTSIKIRKRGKTIKIASKTKREEIEIELSE